MTDAARINPRAVFGFREFRIYQCARFAAMLGWLMQATAVGYQVYSLTGRKIDLGYVGLATFLPAILLSLVTGHVADRYDRRKIILICQVVVFCGALALLGISQMRSPSVLAIYAVLFLIGAARAFHGPASQAFMPHLIPPEYFASAVAWNSTTWQGAAILGPALGGILYDFGGAGAVYGLDAALTAVAVILILSLRTRTGRMEQADSSWSTLLAGLHYVWSRKAILGAISMDLFAVLLGGATVLLPVYAKDILQVDETGFGFLRSAPAIGAGLTALAVAHMQPFRRAGAAMLWCVAIFGLATIAFGISTNFLLSLVCLAIMGAADMVSVVVRHTLVQLVTPPEMRGRVSAVNLVFIGASNELGDFESGVMAECFGTVPAVVIGGVGTILVVIGWTFAFPQLRQFKSLAVVPDYNNQKPDSV